MNMKEIMVENCISPTRLDRYLRLIYPLITQGLIEKYLRKGMIKINKAKSQSSTRVQDGDILEISNSINLESFLKIDEDRKYSESDIALAKKIIVDYKIYEDENFIAINKPSGIASQGGEKLTLSIDRALQYLNNSDSKSYKLVHRLDRETSGVFLVAKSRDAAITLTQGFKDRIILKNYLAILVGNLKKSEGKITAKIKKDLADKKQIVDNAGDEAVTHYKSIAQNDKLCFVVFFPKTGRMHQLRVHSAHLGNPILGDSKYGVKGSNLYLHAYQIEMPKTMFGEKITITAKLPDYFLNIINKQFGIDSESFQTEFSL
jgi:23S rRNA pseudouridine955/2504/2580 synthase